jgi:hypothetical protein
MKFGAAQCISVKNSKSLARFTSFTKKTVSKLVYSRQKSFIKKLLPQKPDPGGNNFQLCIAEKVTLSAPRCLAKPQSASEGCRHGTSGL